MSAEMDRKEVESLILRYLDSLWGFALTLVGNKTDAADLVQDTFLRAYHFYYRFEPGTNCKAWLFTIMKNIFINNFHEKRREILPLDAEEDGEFHQGSASEVLQYYYQEGTSGGGEIFRRDIQMALQGLPERLRIVVILKDVEGLNYKEISGILSCPLGTVMSRLARGRSLLKQALMDYHQSPGLKKVGKN